MSAPLTLAVILGLATNPACGGAVPGSEFGQRLAAIALHESGGDALVIGVNADRARRLPAAVVRSPDAASAVKQARALMASGRSIDLGLMQINSANLARHGLTIETAFDPCRSMAAGADHYAADVAAVWNMAHRRYNTGSVTGGSRYVAEIERVLARVKQAQSDPLEVAAAPVATPRPPPSMADALRATPPVPNDGTEFVDALHPGKDTP